MKAAHLVPLAAIVACSAQKPISPKPMNEPTDATTAEVKARIEPLVRDLWAGAVAVAIVDASGERFVSVGADPDTPFEIGSVSKTFTALALATMVQDHTVTLDTEVSALLPETVKMPAHGRAITLADLATHTSGLPRLPGNFAPGNPRDPYADYDAQKLYAFLSGYDPKRAPGETYEYSNLGFGLLGHALARKNGGTYQALLQTRVFAPLDMTATSADGHVDPKLAIGHDADGNEVGPWKMDALAGAGQVRSTARDMAKYLRAQLASSGPLSAAIALTHEKRHPLDPPDSGDIALGWHVSPKGVFWHNGETGGSHSFVACDLQKHVAIAVLASGATSMIDRIGKDILAIARGETPGPSPLPATIQIADPEPFVGTYRASPTFAFAVTREGTRLFVQATGQSRLGLYGEETDLFYLRAVEAKIRFEREGSKITGLVLLQGGNAVKAPRE
jgi:CubicO group peptidase (beta-lactamase class C family)